MRKLALALLISGFNQSIYAAMFSDTEKVTPIIEYKESKAMEYGYQRVEATASGGIAICKDSFASKAARALFKVGNKAALTVMLDQMPMVLYIYDKKTGSCTKTSLNPAILIPYKRTDVASLETHRLHITYLDETKIEAISTILDMANDVAALSSTLLVSEAAKIPLANLAGHVDGALSTALSSQDSHTTILTLPPTSHRVIEIKLSLNGKPAKLLGNIKIDHKTSMLRGETPEDVITKVLIGEKSVAEEIKPLRGGISIQNYRGNHKMVRRDCEHIRNKYSSTLTNADLDLLLESYLVSTHKNYITPLYLHECFGDSNPADRKLAALRQELIDYANSAESSRDTSFMDDFSLSSTTPSVDANLKIEFPPSGFTYRTAGELLAAPNQKAASCYQFSKNNPRSFYFVKVLDGKAFYFKVSVDQAYTMDQSKKGQRSTITSMFISDNVYQLGDMSEYVQHRSRCIKEYVASATQ